MNELGEIRPSQLIFTFGVGSLVDLPNMSALVMGLDDWDTRYCKEIEEDRLVAAIQKRLGAQLTKLYLPPMKLDGMDRDPAAPAVGAPVAPFPRWQRCSLCDTLATVESGVFKLSQDPYRPDRTQYVHQGCLKSLGGKPPAALSVRFLIACREGHLTDFPWLEFVHKGNVPCQGAQLSLREYGASGDASDIVVQCHSCGSTRRMADAFDSSTPFKCRGHHPHLRLLEPNCPEPAKTIFSEATTLGEARLTKLSRENPKWLPASEVRGEGIFIRIREEALLAWQDKPEVQRLQLEFFESHKAWRTLRKLDPPEEHFPGVRLVLLHSLAHALMRQIVLDCGYTAASVRERLYSRQPGDVGGPMAGVLLYTAAPDSEGTLGGLVELGDPVTLGRHMEQALESMRLCASDPLCAEHRPDTLGRTIQGACCHACQFAPETSCERGNRYLDRSVLVNTFTSTGTAFFD